MKLALVFGLVVLGAVAIKAEERTAFEIVKVDRTFEHKERGGRLEGGSNPWTENFAVEGGILHSYTIHEMSSRNVKNFRIDAGKEKLVISGRTKWDAGFGAGGNYKAKVQAVFLRPVLITTNPDDLEFFMRHLDNSRANLALTSEDADVIRLHGDKIKSDLKALKTQLTR